MSVLQGCIRNGACSNHCGNYTSVVNCEIDNHTHPLAATQPMRVIIYSNGNLETQLNYKDIVILIYKLCKVYSNGNIET